MTRRGLRFVAALACAALASGCRGDYWLGGAPLGAAGMPTSGGADPGLMPSLTLEQDIVLTGEQTLELGDAACVIQGNGHSIRSLQPWHGHVWLHDCRLVDLGSEATPSIELTMDESAWTKLERCTFDRSGRVRVTNYADSTTAFTSNTILGNALLAEPPLRDDADPIFSADGADSTGQKAFQGNKVLKGFVSFGRAAHWLVGGDTEQESNIIVGRRGGIELFGSDFVVRGNYVHDVFVPSPGLPQGNQESALAVAYETSDVLVEHNVLRKGHWVVRGMVGEFRYNAVLDPGASGWLQQPVEDTKIHHNLFLSYAWPGQEQGLAQDTSLIDSGLTLVNFRASGIEVFNNTFDGGGSERRFLGPAITVEDASFIDSLRSNAFVRFPFELPDGSQAALRPPLGEDFSGTPARLGYADYNLFYAPAANPAKNYGLSVTGLDERADPGFALNDATPGGAVDQQVEPQFVAEPPLELPFDEAKVVAGSLSVWQVLGLLRALYTPASQSPLVDAGDPADGAGSDIGAIGVGVPNASDRFGGVAP